MSKDAAGHVVMETQLAGKNRDGVYVTFRGTAGAEVQGSSARGPDIGLNFHNTGKERKRESERERRAKEMAREVKGFEAEREREMWK